MSSLTAHTAPVEGLNGDAETGLLEQLGDAASSDKTYTLG
jgi:hypothetical protein